MAWGPSAFVEGKMFEDIAMRTEAALLDAQKPEMRSKFIVLPERALRWQHGPDWKYSWHVSWAFNVVQGFK
jgi:hypothetical protein